jgi:hypothetical protein
MLSDEVVSFWGKDHLRRWSRASLVAARIPESSKSYLSSVGLPIHETWTLKFDADAEHLPQIPNKPHYRRIGFDDIVPICLDEDRAGQVTAVESEIGGIERFINSSVECFGECLVAYQRYRLDAQVSEEAEIENIIDSTEEQMRKADRTAFLNSENWWPLILEQMRQGLL